MSVQQSDLRDPALVAEVDLARAAAQEEAGDERVGEHVSYQIEDEAAVTHLFEAEKPGYQGWRWAVTISSAGPDADVTVSEVVLLPGPTALVAPEWIPWQDRVQAGDLGVGDLLPTAPDDPRLAPAYVQSDDPAVEQLAMEIGLGRVRVMSRLAREEAAARWLEGEFGPRSDMARGAPAHCGTCGFYLPLAGSLQAAFGTCGNELSPADGHVVHAEYGCGAHSEAEVEQVSPVLVADLIYDDALLDVEPLTVVDELPPESPTKAAVAAVAGVETATPAESPASPDTSAPAAESTTAEETTEPEQPPAVDESATSSEVVEPEQPLAAEDSATTSEIVEPESSSAVDESVASSEVAGSEQPLVAEDSATTSEIVEPEPSPAVDESATSSEIVEPEQPLAADDSATTSEIVEPEPSPAVDESATSSEVVEPEAGSEQSLAVDESAASSEATEPQAPASVEESAASVAAAGPDVPASVEELPSAAEPVSSVFEVESPAARPAVGQPAADLPVVHSETRTSIEQAPADALAADAPSASEPSVVEPPGEAPAAAERLGTPAAADPAPGEQPPGAGLPVDELELSAPVGQPALGAAPDEESDPTAKAVEAVARVEAASPEEAPSPSVETLEAQAPAGIEPVVTAETSPSDDAPRGG